MQCYLFSGCLELPVGKSPEGHWGQKELSVISNHSQRSCAVLELLWSGLPTRNMEQYFNFHKLSLIFFSQLCIPKDLNVLTTFTSFCFLKLCLLDLKQFNTFLITTPKTEKSAIENSFNFWYSFNNQWLASSSSLFISAQKTGNILLWRLDWRK